MRQPQPDTHPRDVRPPSQRRRDERPVLEVVEDIAGRPAPGPLALLLRDTETTTPRT